MKHLKLFEKLTPEELATRKGYEVGDLVYNRILKKDITIVSNDEYKEKYIAPNRYNDDFCTLGAVGENPTTYSLTKKGGGKNKNSAYGTSDEYGISDEYFHVLKSEIDSKIKLLKNSEDKQKLKNQLKRWLNENAVNELNYSFLSKSELEDELTKFQNWLKSNDNVDIPNSLIIRYLHEQY